MLNSSVGGPSDESFRLPGAESQRAADAIQDRFPQETLYTLQRHLPLRGRPHQPDTQGSRRAGRRRSSPTYPTSSPSASPYDPRGPTVSDDAATAFATVGFDIDKIDTDGVRRGRRRPSRGLRDAGIQVEYDGGLGYATDDAHRRNSEMIGILIAVVVLAVAFGSLVAMSLPIVVALIGLLVGSSAIGIMSGAVPGAVDHQRSSPSMLGLGVGIDYALFILARHRQNLADGHDRARKPSAGPTRRPGCRCCSPGVTVVVAILGLKVAGIPMMTDDGLRLRDDGRGHDARRRSPCCPRLLGLVEPRVNSAPGARSCGRGRRTTPTRGPARWAATVVARPVRYGARRDRAARGPRDPGRSRCGPGLRRRRQRRAVVDAPAQAYDLIADGYGPGTNGPLEVVARDRRRRGRSPPRRSATSSDATGRRPGRRLGRARRWSTRAGDLAIIAVTPTTVAAGRGAPTLLVHRLRTDVLPTATRRAPTSRRR